MVERSRKATKTAAPKEAPRRKVDPFVEAAGKAKVPVEEFRLYMLRVARGYSGKQWSSWENWRRPIPEKYVIDFMHERDKQAPDSASAAR